MTPSTARLEPSRESLFSTLSAAAESLQVGEAPDSMLLIAAPGDVDWGPYGLTKGDDAWVRAGEPLRDPNSVWLHEYVHLRQSYDAATDARWTTEAMAEYYAALLTLERGYIGVTRFRHHLAEGTDSRYDDAVLAEPETWTERANYVKGALVWGVLDRRLRARTDSGYAASDVFAAMNERDGEITHEELRRIVTRLGDSTTARTLDRYVTTSATAQMWTRPEHRGAFSHPLPRITTEPSGEFSIRGPYRNITTPPLPVVVPGEVLTLKTRVRNEGEATGRYSIPLQVNGTTVMIKNGTLEGGDSTVIPFRHLFEQPGTYRVEVNGSVFRIEVAAVATPRVRTISIGATQVNPGEEIPIRIVLDNPAARPAGGTVPVVVDGTRRSGVPVRLGVDDTKTRTIRVALSEPGVHLISVGETSATVRVVSPPPTHTDTSSTTPSPTPTEEVLETTDTTAREMGLTVSLVTLLTLAVYTRLRRD
ncbi:MAG: hypothetical protein ABEJ27_02300 [Halodesulfurarchaeum sp.]